MSVLGDGDQQSGRAWRRRRVRAQAEVGRRGTGKKLEDRMDTLTWQLPARSAVDLRRVRDFWEHAMRCTPFTPRSLAVAQDVLGGRGG